jgi:hypothetical protein
VAPGVRKLTTSVNRDRLAKVLALLANPVEGEALAAARMAVKLLADAGMRPEQLVDGIPAFARACVRGDPRLSRRTLAHPPGANQARLG